MSYVHSARSRVVRLAGIGALALAATVMVAAPAHAHGPEQGKKCAVLGAAETVHSRTYVCTVKASGAMVWAKPLPASRSTLKVVDGWAKAAPAGMMSAAFGIVNNPASKPVRVVAAMSPFGPMQLHEVVMKDGAMVMQQKKGGFTIPARGSLELKPGGNHLMFMKLAKPITVGEMVPVTLVTSTGALLKTSVMAKNYAGANEEYDAGTMGDM